MAGRPACADGRAMIERGGGTHERYWRVGMACELRHPVSALQALGEISHQRAIASCQHVDERHSEAAYLAAARLEAHRFLEKEALVEISQAGCICSTSMPDTPRN
jgi:hypothetical protein